MVRAVAGEWTRAAPFVALGFLLQAGLVLGIASGDSLFLAHIGPEGLPAAYVLQTLVMLVYTGSFFVLSRRFGIDRLFQGMLVAIAIGGIAIWGALETTSDTGLYYAIKLYAGMWYFGLYTLFWTFLDSYFDLIDAKRFYSLFAAGSAAGGMAGGGLVTVLAGAAPPGAFFLVWAALSLATLPLLARIRRRCARIDVNEDDVEPDAGALRGALRGAASLGQSRYAIALTAGFFLIAVTATICDYQYMRVFALARTEADLAALFGRVTFVASLANVLITLFLFNALVTRFGVRNIALLQPIAFGLIFLWFAIAPGMGAAIAGFLAYHALMMAIDINNGNLLMFGLPAARRKELRTLIEGICLPGAAACAGLFLLFVAAGFGILQIALIGVACALLTLGFNLVVRSDYVLAIASNLRAGWLDLSALPPRASAFAGGSFPSLPAVRQALAVPDPNRVARMDRIVAEHGVDAIEPLLQMAGNYSACERQIVERLILTMGPAALPLLVEAAGSSRYPVRARSIALRALGKLDFERLGRVASPLILRTAARAFEFLGRYDALADSHTPGAAITVLRRINLDYPALTREVVLEAMTIAGRLPPYEAIIVALNGGPSRERGFAIETVEQAAGRELRRLLAPWIAGWPADRQLDYARKEGLLPAMAERDAIGRAMMSAFPLEAAAAGQQLWEQGERHSLIEKYSVLPHAILEETIRVLRARTDGQDAGLTPIECVAAVMNVARLSIFSFVHLEWLAPFMPTARVPKGSILCRPGETLDGAWIVLEGDAIIETEGDRQAIGPGALVGGPAIAGDQTARETFTAGTGLRVLNIPTKAVLACGEVFPELGVELLRMRAVGD